MLDISEFIAELKALRQQTETQMESYLKQTLKMAKALESGSASIEAVVKIEASQEDAKAVNVDEDSEQEGDVEGGAEEAQEELADVAEAEEDEPQELSEVPLSLPSAEALERLRQQRQTWRSGFLEVLSRYVVRQKKHRRLSTLFDRFNDKRGELVRKLPVNWVVSKDDFLAEFGELPKKLKRKVRWKKPKTFLLAGPVNSYITKSANKRFALEDGIISALSRILILATRSWEQLTSDKTLEPDLKAKRNKALEEVEMYAQQWKEHCEHEETFLASALLKPLKKEQISKMSEHRLFRDRCFRSLEADLKLQNSVEQIWDKTLADLEGLHSSLDKEFERLEAERLALVALLREERSDPEEAPNFPKRRAFVVPYASRFDKFAKGLLKAEGSLPPTQESIDFKGGRNPSKTKAKQLKPRQAFAKAREHNERFLKRVLQERIKIHLRRQKEVDQAREVVLFAAETAVDEPGSSLVSEAIKNSINLLNSEPPITERAFGIEESFEKYLKDLYPEFRERLGRDRVGLVKFLLQRKGGLTEAAHELRERSEVWSEDLSGWAEEKGYQFMEHIGWLGQESAAAPVPTKRVLLPKMEPDSDVTIPRIYRRLFEIEPLTDPRFLIGRDEEMESFREAREFWKSGRTASILLSGHRGSGKSSLLNCVEAEIFADDTVTRFEASERLTTTDELHKFLAKAYGLKSPKKLIETISERGGVVILEEVERLYLRTVGGFEALDALMEVIAKTQEKCLWVLAINETALRLLQRVRFLSGRFSHRIRASGVDKDALQRVITLRHDLSGLKLKFDTPNPDEESGTPFYSRWLDKDPEKTFFRKLSQRSRGVFRTALELWLGHIRIIEGGCLFMSVFHSLDTEPLMEELGQTDFFTLTAILQHGSLTAEQLARIFSSKVEDKETQIDELMGRELLEMEGSRPGVRVRPEAMPVVKEALFRKNLL